MVSPPKQLDIPIFAWEVLVAFYCRVMVHIRMSSVFLKSVVVLMIEIFQNVHSLIPGSVAQFSTVV